MNLKEMAQREGLPASVTVEREETPSGILIRASQGERGAEILITPSACKMYGEGPSINVALDRLRQLISGEGLPVSEGGSWHREELADF
ncbi:hypothetical protein GCM10017783_08220 [Deinococcus piscis]|uniref:Uncharacterized protein n=1 Tax=Deinococcus piscis TaxID=394230 RepID=A0ABQ3K341_9DEIO|nr:hypothetical protein [Deinococcus piscis]GHF98634.1 hypothetical protein GCM10017783_08220 [Deinococcus piscis]